MSDAEDKRVDVLFIVPDAKGDTWRRAIKHVLWTFEIDKTFEVMSADTFVRLYGDIPVEEMNAKLKKLCKAFTNTTDISKREWKEFEPLRQRYYDYVGAKPQEGSQP